MKLKYLQLKKYLTYPAFTWLELNRKYDKGKREFLIYCSDLQYKNAIYRFQIQKKTSPSVYLFNFSPKMNKQGEGDRVKPYFRVDTKTYSIVFTLQIFQNSLESMYSFLFTIFFFPQSIFPTQSFGSSFL